MAGKIIGNLSVGLTQLGLWIVFGVVIFLAGRGRVDWLDRISIGGDFLLLMALILLPTFVMVGSLMAAVGATVTETREAQQISGLFSLPIAIPYWLTYQIMTNPNGPVAVGLSFFPLTAPVTLTMRAGFTQIPTAQLVLNIAVLIAFAIGALWLAARAFRLGMLSYGKKVTLREIFARPRQSLKPREAAQ
jgi:ABC-2 type transport system permease protein